MTDTQKTHSFLLAPTVVLTWVEIKLSPFFKVQTAVRQDPMARRLIRWFQQHGYFTGRALCHISISKNTAQSMPHESQEGFECTSCLGHAFQFLDGLSVATSAYVVILCFCVLYLHFIHIVCSKYFTYHSGAACFLFCFVLIFFVVHFLVLYAAFDLMPDLNPQTTNYYLAKHVTTVFILLRLWAGRLD